MENGYVVLSREWQTGDVMELELDMPVQRIVGHPFSGLIRERVAIQRGPVVYCLEGVDNPTTHEPILPAHAKFQAEYRKDFLGGVVTITTEDVAGNRITAIPYFAWDNRPVANTEQDWLVVWLRQEEWFSLRQLLDGNNRREWEHRLYQPIEG